MLCLVRATKRVLINLDEFTLDSVNLQNKLRLNWISKAKPLKMTEFQYKKPQILFLPTQLSTTSMKTKEKIKKALLTSLFIVYFETVDLEE